VDPLVVLPEPALIAFDKFLHAAFAYAIVAIVSALSIGSTPSLSLPLPLSPLDTIRLSLLYKGLLFFFFVPLPVDIIATLTRRLLTIT
jgi:hypothetical protein